MKGLCHRCYESGMTVSIHVETGSTFCESCISNKTLETKQTI
jgi:formylmethanofuran dehydrogenase subunit E